MKRQVDRRHGHPPLLDKMDFVNMLMWSFAISVASVSTLAIAGGSRSRLKQQLDSRFCFKCDAEGA